MNSPFEIQKEAIYKPPPLECVPDGLVEEKTTIAIPHEEEYMMQRYDFLNIYIFFCVIMHMKLLPRR